MKLSSAVYLPFVAAGPAISFPPVQKILGSSTASEGLSVPLLGFGTWNLKTENHNASKAVSYAIQTGYRHIDCAAAYFNEKEVGVGIADGLEKTGLEREQIWVTSKLWNDQYDQNFMLSP